MNIKIQREQEFIPTCEKNRKEAKPVKFRLHYLTPGERDDCYEWHEKGLVPKTKKFFTIGVISIENLIVNGEPVETGQQLLDTPGLEGFYNEVCAEILRQNARQDLKN